MATKQKRSGKNREMNFKTSKAKQNQLVLPIHVFLWCFNTRKGY